MQKKATLSTLLAGLVLLAGCRDDRSPAGPLLEDARSAASAPDSLRDPAREAARVQPLPGPYRGLDSVFVHMSDTIPGFAGFHFDGAGNVMVRLVNPDRPGVSPQAQERVRARLEREVRRFNGTIRVQPAEYTFAQLAEWRVRLDALVFTRPGVVLTDVDEVNNRITIGVRDAQAEALVERAIASLSIPRRAVVIRSGLEIRTEQCDSVSGECRPVVGGVITKNNLGEPCTLGFFANSSRFAAQRFLVINSHCSTNFLGPDVPASTFVQQAYHDSVNYFDYIGQEYYDPDGFPCIYDPEYFTVTKGDGDYECRYSDAALITASDPYMSYKPGYIAKTDREISKIIDPYTPHFMITNKAPYAYAGERVNKVGHNTGWTSGEVVETCVSYGFSDYQKGVICAEGANYYSGGGDSGAPVFLVQQFSYNYVTLVGMHFGAVWDRKKDTYYRLFSPMQYIEYELGTLKVIAGEVQ